MILMQGTGVSAGIAEGRMLFFHRPDSVVCRQAKAPSEELNRLAHARKETILQLEALADRCREKSGAEAAALFEAHALFAQDEDYLEYIRIAVETDRCSAETAVRRAGEHFAAVFTAMNDAYMQARAEDIRDVTRRIIANLSGTSAADAFPPEPAVLAADDFSPSETVQLNRKHVLALITRAGSANSHTAILARMLGIPAVCALGSSLKAEYEGRTACVDGESGQVFLDPDASTLCAIQNRRDRLLQKTAALKAMIGKEDVSSDGRHIGICCNIASTQDLPAALASDARGIGLFRSEFLYLAADRPPSEEAQFRAYRSVATAMKGKRVIIRTLDAGADKQIPYLESVREENPALGMRGIRFSLNHPELFRPQLRALYRASAFGRIAIMFPMIAALWEVHACRKLCREVMSELEAEGIAFNPDTEIGIMIETPASVLIADTLAQEADFFSVGTNDLTQYLLACDRQSESPGRFFDPRHPAVFRALKKTARAAHASGKRIGVCGDLAADAALLPVFLALGIDELSVPPSVVLPLRAHLRSLRAEDCDEAPLRLFGEE